MTTDSSKYTLLNLAIQASVTLYIEEIKRYGYIPDSLLTECREVGQELASNGDNLLYASRPTGKTAKLFNRVARALAVLGFQPGGVNFLGCKWESKFDE